MALTPISNSVEFVQDSVPTTAADGDTWLDTSQSPPQLKVFDADANAFVRPRSIQNLDEPVSEAGASASVKRLDLRFVREMSRLFFDRSLAELNFSEGTFEIFTDKNNVTTSSDIILQPGANGRALIGKPFNIGAGSLTGTTLSTNAGGAEGVSFSDDGTTMVECDGSNNQLFVEYSLNTPFDIGTASTTGTVLGSQDRAPKGVTFADNGTTLIEVGKASNTFYEYSLTTAFDIGSATFTGKSLSGQDSSPMGVTFSEDGTTMVEVGRDTGKFYEYSLSTPFDIGTASTTGAVLNSQDGSPLGMTFSADGTTMVEAGVNSELFYEYSLSTPFDIGTATFTGTTLGTQGGATGVTFIDNGKKMVGVTSGTFNEYFTSSQTTGTGTVSKSVTLAFTPTTAVVEDTRENGLNASYDIADGNGNTVTISQSEIGTVVDCSSLTDGSLTVTVNLDNPNTAPNTLRDFAVYFD